MRRWISLICVTIVTTHLAAINEVVLAGKWEHPEEIAGRVQFSLVDKNAHVVIVSYKIGRRLITPLKVHTIIPTGQGPDEAMNTMSICLHPQGDLALLERPDRFKIFKKANDTYKWVKNVWFKRGADVHIPANSVYADNKWFIAGFEVLKRKNTEFEISFLKVYDEGGKPIKNLLIEKFSTSTLQEFSPGQMRRYVLPYKDKIFYLVENELKATIISMKNLLEEKKVNLEAPVFYKKMPGDFFACFTAEDSLKDIELKMEHWLTSYSRITKAVTEKDYLIVQVRTCDPKLKKFALLFYNADTFKLEKTIFIDDLLLGAKDGKLFCFGGGDPGLDDGITKTVINIYTIN